MRLDLGDNRSILSLFLESDLLVVDMGNGSFGFVLVFDRESLDLFIDILIISFN